MGSKLIASITDSVFQKAKEKWAAMQNNTMQSGGASLLNTNTSITPESITPNGETFLEPTLDMIPDSTRDAVEPSTRLPRHTSEILDLEPTRPNP